VHKGGEAREWERTREHLCLKIKHLDKQIFINKGWLLKPTYFNLEVGPKWYSACLGSTELWVWTPVPTPSQIHLFYIVILPKIQFPIRKISLESLTIKNVHFSILPWMLFLKMPLNIFLKLVWLVWFDSDTLLIELIENFQDLLIS
jgi:hypothetical protein